MGSRTGSQLAVVLMGTSILAGLPGAAFAQDAPAAPTPVEAAAAEPAGPIQSISVVGAQRLEADTIRSYVKMRVGQPYTQAAADQALKDLFATELFADVQIRNSGGNVVIEVKESPVINRIVLEGNKRLKEEKILPEIKLAPRQIFTRSKVRADVNRIIELYKRQGRFAATVEPKMVMLDQNRVDIVFEISEGPKSKVRQINVIGNEEFSDSELRGEMLTKQARAFRLFSSGTSYDPDRMAFDQQKLRQFYLTNGYADFRVVSAVAELTPDKEDFIITYVVEEGQRYKFGEVAVDSQLRDFDGERLAAQLPMKAGDWYNAKLVEDTIDKLNETAGAFGYAFADVRPSYARNKDDLTMGIKFTIGDAPRVYVESINVNGNTLTQDKVVRREFRLAEGDAFNSLQVKRSTNRINSLGYFQEKFEVEQKPGAAPDRIVLEANVEEKPTGELQLSAGFSSIESFIFQGSIQQRNFRGRGQTLGTSLSYSRYAKSAELSFTEPYVFDRNISAGVTAYRRDYNSFNYLNNDRNTTYKQATTGISGRVGVPLTEFMSAIGSYTFNLDDVSLDQSQFYADLDGDGVSTCEPFLAGRYLCEAIGKRTSSILGLNLIYDSLDNRVRPSRGRSISIGVDFAGLGGSVKYARARANIAQFYPVGKGFIFSLRGEGGWIRAFGNNGVAAGADPIRLTDRFYLGEPELRGFDIRGIGPRVIRKYYLDSNGDAAIDAVNFYCFLAATGTTAQVRTVAAANTTCPTGQTLLSPDTVSTDRKTWGDDALGGKFYYLAHAELEIPLGSGAKELGLRPSVFVDAGAVWGVKRPVAASNLTTIVLYQETTNGVSSIVSRPINPSDGSANTAVREIGPYQEFYLGDTPKPRISVGIGVNWNSPFGPFRIDFAHALTKADGDDTKSFTFNVGTQF
ncbi:MAG: outer membrane protein assembly factor BamA [Novosphingobium sp.]